MCFTSYCNGCLNQWLGEAVAERHEMKEEKEALGPSNQTHKHLLWGTPQCQRELERPCGTAWLICVNGRVRGSNGLSDTHFMISWQTHLLGQCKIIWPKCNFPLDLERPSHIFRHQGCWFNALSDHLSYRWHTKQQCIIPFMTRLLGRMWTWTIDFSSRIFYNRKWASV